MSREVTQNDLVEQCRNRIEHSDIDAVGGEQKDVVAIRQQSLNRVEEWTALDGCFLGS